MHLLTMGLAGALALAAAPGMAQAPREHASFTYQKITWSTAQPQNTSNWIRNGQPHTSPPPGDALADLPPAPNGRIPPHTPEIALKRGVSPSATPENAFASPKSTQLSIATGKRDHRPLRAR